MFTKYEDCIPLNAKVIKVSFFLKKSRPKNMPRNLSGLVSNHLGEIAPLMPILSSAKGSVPQKMSSQ